MTTTSIGPCDVCGYVYGDWQPREVSYCGVCDAWICAAHVHRYDLRSIAAARRAWGRVRAGR
jgi:hypothetical protein